jgi:hypothetical protein
VDPENWTGALALESPWWGGIQHGTDQEVHGEAFKAKVALELVRHGMLEVLLRHTGLNEALREKAAG